MKQTLGRHGRNLVAVAMIVLALAARAQRPPPKISEDRDLKEFDLSQWRCLDQPEGSARTPDGIERNRLKNRSARQISLGNLPEFTVARFLRHVADFDAATVYKRRKDLTAAQRQKLQPLENEMVQITGYLGLAYCGPPETSNCASVDFHDWHLEVYEKAPQRPPKPGDTTPIICEITPRTQNAIFGEKISVQELTAFFRRADLSYEATGHPARKIRVAGYLLWDDEHNGRADVGPTVERINPNKYHNPWRQTAWEIHPVIKIVPVDSPTAATSPPGSATAPTPTAVHSTASPAPSMTSTATPAASSPANQAHWVTITAPVTIQIPYGETTLGPGTKVEFISRGSSSVTVRYMDEAVEIPLSSTDQR